MIGGSNPSSPARGTAFNDGSLILSQASRQTRLKNLNALESKQSMELTVSILSLIWVIGILSLQRLDVVIDEFTKGLAYSYH